MIEEKSSFDLLFSKPIYQLSQSKAESAAAMSEMQLEYTRKCANLADELTQTIFTGDVDHAQCVLDQILVLDRSVCNFPFETFNSNWVPKLLSVFIHDYPNTDLFRASLRVLEILTRGKCIEQLFNDSFISDLLKFIFENIGSDLVGSAIVCLRNIANHSRNGALCNYKAVISGLIQLLGYNLEPNVMENVFYCLSGYLKYTDLFDDESLMKLICNLMPLFSVDIQEYQVHGLYCLFLIFNNWEKYSDVILPENVISLLFEYLNIQKYENLTITCILFLTKIFKHKTKQIATYAIKFIDSNWLCNIWTQTHSEIHLYLFDFYISIFSYDEGILNSSLHSGLFDLFVSELSLSKFNHRKSTLRFLLSLTQNQNVLCHLVSRGFITITKEFIETDCNLEKPIFRFYMSYFQLITSKAITDYSLLEIEELSDALQDMLENPKLSKYVNELQQTASAILGVRE